MKAYEVVFDPDAYAEALDAAEYIWKNSPTNSATWFAGFEKAIDSLRHSPARCGRARESELLRVDLRQYIYHSHRIIFRIEKSANVVRILHVRHSARRAIGEPGQE